MLAILLLLVGGCGVAAFRFFRRPVPGAGKTIEVASGVWTLLMYLGLGALPALLRAQPGS
jgi:4-hydroxybenzoate polyprenyltransferase